MNPRTDAALLRRFEPIIRYTRGEQFFPMDVAHYLNVCSFWVKYPDSTEPIRLQAKGELTLDKLAQPRPDRLGAISFLKFADPLTVTELASYKLRESFTPHDPTEVFHAGRGRLARVGYFSRLADALFSLSLLARGRVPGDAATAAFITYEDILEKVEHYGYYGRVVRQNGWIVLQYWFFYAFNNWRSDFYGINDHEADWEMICIYLSEAPDGEISPEWTAYASHDFSGDDLRRRWDDPELEKVGEHPVVYAGAGSHASYYRAGDYLVELEISFLKPVARLIAEIQKFWRGKLRQYYENPAQSNENGGLNTFRMPFVDYARGDGRSIGPGQPKTWSPPDVISEPPAWVSQYRGLWGVYIRDPLAGENAPAGPMYNRDGSVRRAWYDPLGWAGLDKLPTRHQALARVYERCETLTARQAGLSQSIHEKSHQLTGLGVEAIAAQSHPHLKRVYKAHQEKLKTLAQEIDQLRAEFAENKAMLEALALYRQQLGQGERSPARAHIRRAHQPIPETELRLGGLLETWAAISIGLMLISLVGLIIFAPYNWPIGLLAIIAVFIMIEATFHKRLAQLITQATIALAILAALILIVDFFPLLAIIGALVASGYMMWENLRELWS